MRRFIYDCIQGFLRNGHFCKKGRLGYRCHGEPNEHL